MERGAAVKLHQRGSMNTTPIAKPDAVICAVCHALISGDPSALHRTGVLVEVSNCGRHVRGRWDMPAPRQPVVAKEQDA